MHGARKAARGARVGEVLERLVTLRGVLLPEQPVADLGAALVRQRGAGTGRRERVQARVGTGAHGGLVDPQQT